jgi:bifunctional non-homologous end joining protein LigD
MVSDDGPALYAATRGLGVEGVVAKRVSSRYLAGRRSRAWLKVKHRSGGWFDLVGWRLPTGRDPVGGLVIADEGHPAGVAIAVLAAVDRAALRHVVERHGTSSAR